MRTTVLLSMLLLTTACGVVEEKKDAALRNLGKATLSGVLRLASCGSMTSSESSGRFTEAVVSETSSSPVPAPIVAPAPVLLAKAENSMSAAVAVPSVSSAGTPAEGSFQFEYSRAEDLPEAIPAMRVLIQSRGGDKHHAEFARVVKRVKSEELVRRNETMKHAVANARVAAAALAERPLHIADFEVHFSEEFEAVRMIPSAPPAPPVPQKECSTQLRTAS